VALPPVSTMSWQDQKERLLFSLSRWLSSKNSKNQVKKGLPVGGLFF
jgi:hypothetical protein